MLLLFLISVSFLLVISFIKKINLVSIYGFFVLFSILYNLVPALNALYGVTLFSLSSDLELINIQLLVVSMSNFAFGIMYYKFYKNVLYKDIVDDKPAGKKSFLILCVVIFAVTLPLVSNYGWHKFTNSGEILEGGAWFTIASYMKYLFVSCYLYYLYKFGMNKGAVFLMVLHTIVMIIDGARTTYLPLFVLTLIILHSKSIKNKKSQKSIYVYIVVCVVLLLVTRALIMSADETLLFNMLMSLTIEACAGSYMSLQTIHAVINEYNLSFTFGTTYLIDTFAWFIPQGDLRDGLLTYNAWIEKLSPVLNEKFAPMGGFYYIAEAMAFIPYVGPVIITLLFALVSIWIELNKNRYRLLYLSYFATFGLLFSKAIFGNIMKLFVVQMFFLGLFLLIERTKKNLIIMAK